MTKYEIGTLIAAIIAIVAPIVGAILSVSYHLGGKISGLSQAIDGVKEIITRDRHEARNLLNEHKVGNDKDLLVVHQRISGIDERVRPLEIGQETIIKLCEERHKEASHANG